MNKKRYLFSPTGLKSWNHARKWSHLRWGRERTNIYFSSAIDVLDKLSTNPTVYKYRDDLSAGTGLKIYPVGRHYFIMDILPNNRLVVLAFEKQERNIPEQIIINKRVIQQELRVIKDKELVSN